MRDRKYMIMIIKYFILLIIILLLYQSIKSTDKTYNDDTKSNKKCANNNLHSQSTNNNHSYRIAVAFYGMSRNLKHTLPSIKHRIFDVLDRKNIQYDVFWHTLITDHIHHLRVDIENGPIDSYNVQLMSPCRFSISDQDTIQKQEFEQFLSKRNLTLEYVHSNITKKVHDVWNDNYYSARNILGAFYTLNSVYDIIISYANKNQITYDAIVVLRPDTAMIKDIDLPLYLEDIRHHRVITTATTTTIDNSIWIPDFQHYGGYNDRAAYENPSVMEIYMRRGIYYRDQYLLSTNGEQFLKFILTEHNITVRNSAMRVLRVRQNNRIAINDIGPKVMNLSIDDIDLKNCIPGNKLYLLPTC